MFSKKLSSMLLIIIACLTMIACTVPCQNAASLLLPKTSKIRVVYMHSWSNKETLFEIDRTTAKGKKLIKKIDSINAKCICLSIYYAILEGNVQFSPDFGIYSCMDIEIIDENGETTNLSLPILLGNKIRVITFPNSSGKKFDITSYFTDEQKKEIFSRMDLSLQDAMDPKRIKKSP